MIRLFLLLLSVCALYISPVYAEKQTHELRSFSSTDFQSLPVLHEGRLKPLDSFARALLREFSGQDYHRDGPAIHWLAETIFNPSDAANQPLFQIRNRALKDQFGLSHTRNIFSLRDLQNGLSQTHDQALSLLQADPQSLTDDQTAFLDLHGMAERYTQLLRGLSLILPLHLNVPSPYTPADQESPFTYLDLVQAEPAIKKDVQTLIQKRGSNPQNYTDQEAELATLAFQLSLIREAGTRNQLFRIMPGIWQDEKTQQDDWFSPWNLLLSGSGSPTSRAYLQHWQDMATAYRTGSSQDWETATANTLSFFQTHHSDLFSVSRFQAEQLYTALKPYRLAIFLYGATILFLLIARPSAPIFERLVWITALTGLGIHAGALALRVFILMRPPVGTLYESVLFVSLVAAALGVLVSYSRKQFLPILVGGLTAILLLLIAPVTRTGGESLDVLAAVLNTGFWLGTHVLIITAGYGICLLCAGLSHGYIVLRYFKGSDYSALPGLYNLIHKVSLAALLFTAIGTILGGIWADQSWGRFWGWDPKENGALLIVLWLIWAQHGRLSGHLRALPFAVFMGGLNIIVALAWFGVNLLGTGLHSYGFTSGMALGLGVFCAFQTFVLGGLWIAIRRKEGS